MKKASTPVVETMSILEGAAEMKEEKKRSMRLVASDKCYLRSMCSMKSDACVRKAKTNGVYEVEQIITNLNVRYYKLTNGYYISSLEAHTLYGEEESNAN